MKNLLASEFLKLRTTRAALLMLALVVALSVFSVVASVSIVVAAKYNLESDQGIRAVLHMAGGGALFVLILGIIVTAGEYRQNTAVDTFLTEPRRIRVLGAKLAASMSAGAAFGAVTAAVTLAAAAAAYEFKGLHLPLSAGLAWQIFIGATVYASLFGGLGASIGSLMRNQLAAIVGTIAVLFVADPMIFELSPAVGKWFPSALGRAVVSDPGGVYLSAPAAGVLLFLYVAAIMSAAAAAERRRDA